MTDRYSVTIYCPDQHLVYDGRTASKHGVGGGVTARIRLARALASLGHPVTMLVNCPREATYDGVRYVPWQRRDAIRTDVLILNTSGGALDLRPVLSVNVEARLRIVWVQGVPAPHGLHEVGLDYLCAPSNFIRRVAQREWAVAPAETFVAYNAADGARARPHLGWRVRPRDPYRLVYTSHPSKGLDAAIGVLRVLRTRDSRYHLHVYGGARLWGQDEQVPAPEDGLVYHGLTGQARLARALRSAGISLNLQAREEPLPLAAIEAMRAGCVVLASPVGGYPEIVRHGHNGFLVPGDHRNPETWRRTADLVTHLVDHPAHARYLRHNAQAVPWDWETMAWTWSGHWEWVLDRKREPPGSHGPRALDLVCAECAGPYLPLADGYHCTACGLYTPGP
jgi:glycosyltransferase involved in cell wall biosynthesis